MDLKKQMPHCFQEVLRASRGEREVKEELLSMAREYSSSETPQVLQGRGLFQKMCMGLSDWMTLPFFDWPTMCSMPSCADAVTTARQTPSNQLETAWVAKHTGLENMPRRPDVSPVRFKACSFWCVRLQAWQSSSTHAFEAGTLRQKGTRSIPDSRRYCV